MGRFERLFEMLPDNVESVLVTSDVNRRYFTGMKSSAGTVLAFRNKAYLLIDFRYIEKARETVKTAEVLETKELYKEISALLRQEGVKNLAIESMDVTVSRLNLMKKHLKCVDIIETDTLSNTINKLRAVKDDEELEYIRKAQEIAESAFEDILCFIKEGVTEREIALELVRRGHRLVADDRVDLVNINKKLTGTCPELTKGVMEVRGIGIINVASMFGISSYKDRQDVDYVIELKLLDENYSFERIDTSEHFKNILGVYIPNIQIPVSSGRNLADLIEVAVRNELLKAQGIDASKEFAKKLNDLLNVKGD